MRTDHFLKNSMIIGAHADDELLWFNSILPSVDEVVVVYREFWAQPGLGERRAAAFSDYPRPIDCLDVPESGAYGCADWSAPDLNEFGIGFRLEAQRREMTRLARRSLATMQVTDPARVADRSVARAYETNFATICERLEPRLKPDMNVFTHNPWGEYGHEEHIQVFRALSLLRDKIGFRLWMSNYCTERALPLAMRHFSAAPGGYIRLPTDKAFAEKVAAVYKRHDCWTWADDWAWFDEECFMEAPTEASDAAPHRHLFPLNFFTIDAPAPSRPWLPIAVTVSAAASAAITAVTLTDL